MTKMMEKRSLLSRLLGDRRGNFAMMTAAVLPVMIAAGGIAMDLTNMVLTRAELQDAVDSAALAAASSLSNDKKSIAEAKDIATKFFKTQLSGTFAAGADLSAGTTVDIQETALAGSAKSFKVSITTGYDLPTNPLTRLFGHTSTKIAAKGTAESATGSKNAISMFLVLDRSGSMSFKTDEIASGLIPCQNWTSSNWGGYPPLSLPCYLRKIAALKSAVTSLTTILTKIDPTSQYVRTGAVSYNDVMQTETNLNWGTTGALAYVTLLPTQPTGGTDSHKAFAKALEKLAPADTSKETEIPEHKAKSGLKPTKFIVFMTDGENTHYDGKSGTSWAEKSDSDTLTSCTAAKTAGVIVYTVAFMAPTRGQTLLKTCATSTSHYYEAEDMAGLVTAFEEIGKSAAAVVSRLTQ